ncbi:MAG: class I SAM-dependent methyltransferase [Candidatus Brockarchaeota archaeon]|nr:class I SAM-dependent methyltransferase [Candidatus Brockarchaeota archaeon]
MGLEYQKKTMEFYNDVAEEFNKTRTAPDPFLEMLIMRGFARVSRLILDNGCGNCRNLKPFSEKIVLIAGDISKNMLKQCRKNKSSPSIHYLQYALTHLPFRNNVFDGIVCIAAIHHLKKNDVVKAIIDMQDVLKDRGWLLISSWSNKILKDKRVLKRIERIGEDYFLVKWGIHKRFYFLMDAVMLKEICEKAGLRNIIALEYGMNSYVLIDGKS